MSGACAVQMQEIHGTAEHEKTGLADNLSRRQRLVLFLFVIAVVTNGACRVKWSRAFDVSMSTRCEVTTLLRSRCWSTCMCSQLCYATTMRLSALDVSSVSDLWSRYPQLPYPPQC